MSALGRVLFGILLATVVLALGDAPYVDELFDVLAPTNVHTAHDAHGAAASSKANPGTTHPSRAIRIYQMLATLFTAPTAIPVPATVACSGYAATVARTPSSVDLIRIERPPALRAA